MRAESASSARFSEHPPASLQFTQNADSQYPARADATMSPVKLLVVRSLDLEHYKATIKGLTSSATAGQGTDRNRARVTGSRHSSRATAAPTPSGSPTSTAAPPVTATAAAATAAAAARRRRRGRAQGGGRNARRPHAHRREHDSWQTDRCSARSTRSRRRPAARGGLLHEGRQHAPEEMYIVGGHMDGHGWGEAANDDGSGTALVMELARIFSMPGREDRSLDPLRALEQRGDGAQRRRAPTSRSGQALQGKEDPAGLRQVSRTEVARHDPARHDAVGSRHAARRRHMARSSGRRPTSTSSSSRARRWRPRRRSSRVFRWRTRNTRPTIPRPSAST